MNHGILDVNQSDSKGFTPLFVAAQNGHTRIVTLLLQNGADVNQPNREGTLCYDQCFARTRGSGESIAILPRH